MLDFESASPSFPSDTPLILDNVPCAMMQWLSLLACCWISTNADPWTDPIDFPLVAVSMANLDDGRVLMWSSGKSAVGFSLRTSKPTESYTYIWDPRDSNPTNELDLSETSHDMFCPGTSVLFDGTVMVTGGSSNARVSLFQTGRGWTRASDMNIGRAYHSNTVLSNGGVFVMGGSWFDNKERGEYVDLYGKIFGGLLWMLRDVFGWLFDWLFPWDRKDGEVWDPISSEWRELPNVKCEGSMVTKDGQGQYRNDNHMWLFQAPNGKIFHAGPSVMTHYISTVNDGYIRETGRRGTHDAMNGNAIMYDIGKLLTVGGASEYDTSPATKEAFVITMYDDSDQVDIRRVGDMNQKRAMQNSVALPNGQVVIIGGCELAEVFDDSTAVLSAELWDPDTETFSTLPPMQIPRTYHSTGLLLYDGTVLAAGGGLCGEDCDVNHLDGEVLTPPYLYSASGVLAPRPKIVSADGFAVAGDIISVQTSGSIATVALVRLSAVTHSVNTDLRRIPLEIVSTTNSTIYHCQVPANPNVSLPGTYFLFVMDADGVPSVSTTISIAPPVSS